MNAAVVLMAYGSPDRLADVPAYYADIRGGRPVAQEHLDDLVERYRALGIDDSGSRSPLNAITEATRDALEDALDLPVYTGMRHWQPRIADAVDAAIAGGADLVVGLVLAPHYSTLSIGKYRALFDEAVAGRVATRFVRRWGDDPGFVGFLADRVRGTDAHVVFTAHSLPARILAEGDPYQDELQATARLVAERAAIRDFSFSYQSESPTGEPWLGPDILDHLEALAADGVARVLVCPVGFVSDHLEIRWDLDREAQQKARELGLDLERIEMPNADPAFVAVLAAIVRRELDTDEPELLLRPLREDEFEAWRAHHEAWYAEDLVSSGGLTPDRAREKAARDVRHRFPEGFASPDNVLLAAEVDGEIVGSVWFAPREEHGLPAAFLYAIEIDERHRGRGLGRRALRLFEQEARSRGYSSLRLNVFGGNERARRLYRSEAWRELAVFMGKEL